MLLRVAIGLILFSVLCNYVDGLKNKTPLKIAPNDITIVKGKSKDVEFSYADTLNSSLQIIFNYSSHLQIEPNAITINQSEKSSVTIYGESVVSETTVLLLGCKFNGTDWCPFNKTVPYIRVVVVHSNVLTIFVAITGWVYFFAWSISFWPQIILNFQRRSVVGLNFDYLVLNIIGFSCYAVYNLLLYFDTSIQNDYENEHPHSLIPVLLNDVLFAVHAFFACLIVASQTLCFDRGTQRVSYICMGLSTVLVLFSVVSLALSLFKVFGWLQFINNLSYVKMAVTLSKYVPQVLLNWRRKSTIGWSIGNVLLDFTGGFMDIAQMVLQALNTDDWSGFYGDPVKFGLGLVSMIFDVIFMIQHYILYRHPKIDSEETKILPKGSFSTEDSGITNGRFIKIEEDFDLKYRF